MAKHIPLKDFFKNPESSSFQLSPDGKNLSYLAPYNRRMNIHVKNLETQIITRVTNLEDRSVAGYMWVTNERLLYVRDFGGDENYHILAVSIDGSNDVDLTPFDNVKAGLIDDLENDEKHVLVSLNTRNPQFFDPYRLNIETGELTILAENPGNISSWMTDHNGKLRIATTTDGVNNSLLYRKTETDEFQVVITTNFRESLSPLFFSFDNKFIYASSNLGRDKAAIIKYDLEKGEEIEELFSHEEVDVSGLSYSKERQVLTTISYTTWKRQYHFLDEKRAVLQNRLEQELGNYEIIIASSNKAEDTYLIRTFSDRSLGAYYIYHGNDDKLEQLAEVSPWLDENEMAEMKPIQYTSRDGLVIHGYLTLPKGVDASNLPVVINPHGGPWARDNWGFNPEIQFLANRGYAVLQMNFRGSVGYGRAFWEASFKEWGLKMQDDITDGVNWLIENGIADKEKVAIYGGSYGGYTTLAGITLTPDLYACAIDYVGVSTLFTFMNTIPPYWEQFRQMLYEMVGDPENEADKARMEATSPVFLIDKIKRPLLIAQGANDPRVAQAESDQMVEALKANGIDVEYILKTDEGHGFRNEENRFEFYEMMETFLGKYL